MINRDAKVRPTNAMREMPWSGCRGDSLSRRLTTSKIWWINNEHYFITLASGVRIQDP